MSPFELGVVRRARAKGATSASEARVHRCQGGKFNCEGRSSVGEVESGGLWMALGVGRYVVWQGLSDGRLHVEVTRLRNWCRSRRN